MAEVSVGAAVGEGFSLIRRAPMTVLIWGAVQAGLAVIVFALLSPVYAAMFEAFRSAAASGGGPPNIAANPALMQTQGLSYLVDLIEVAAGVVLYCAAFRSVLHPEQSRFGYMRLGMAELFLGAVWIGAYFAFFIGLLVVVIAIAIIVGIFAAMQMVGIAIGLGVVAAVAVLVGLVYVALRFSLIGPMIVDDGKFHFEDAWRLTRGHVLQLLAVGLVLFAVALGAILVVWLVFAALSIGGLIAMAGGAGNLQGFLQQPPSALIAHLVPLFVVGVLIWVPVTGCMNAIVMTPWARVYRDLKPVDLAAAFA